MGLTTLARDRFQAILYGRHYSTRLANIGVINLRIEVDFVLRLPPLRTYAPIIRQPDSTGTGVKGRRN